MVYKIVSIPLYWAFHPIFLITFLVVSIDPTISPPHSKKEKNRKILMQDVQNDTDPSWGHWGTSPTPVRPIGRYYKYTSTVL